jgi:hypothetical protein
MDLAKYSVNAVLVEARSVRATSQHCVEREKSVPKHPLLTLVSPKAVVGRPCS